MPRPRTARAPLPPGFGVLWTTVAIDLVGFGIVLPLLPRYAEDLGASPTTVGLLVASFSLAQLVFAPFLGRLSDRIGRKPVLVISLFGTAVGSALTGLAGSVWLLFVGRILDGASGASVSVAQAAASDLAPPAKRARLLGLLGAAFGVGFVAGPAIGGIGALFGTSVPFFIAAAIALVNAVVAIVRLPETNPQSGAHEAAEQDAERLADLPGLEGPGLAEPAHLDLARHQGSAEPDAAGRSALRRLIAAAAVGVAAFAGFEATFSLLAERRLDLSLAGTAAVFAGIGVVLVLVQAVLVGPVNDRLGEGPTLRLGLVVNAIGLVLLVPQGGWGLVVPAVVALTVGQGLLTPTLSSAVADRAGQERGRWLGWQQSAGAGARVVGPAAAGALFQHVGVGAPYAAGAVLMVVAVVLVATVAPVSEPATGGPDA